PQGSSEAAKFLSRAAPSFYASLAYWPGRWRRPAPPSRRAGPPRERTSRVKNLLGSVSQAAERAERPRPASRLLLHHSRSSQAQATPSRKKATGQQKPSQSRQLGPETSPLRPQMRQRTALPPGRSLASEVTEQSGQITLRMNGYLLV